jgi:hypothetical protein
LYNDSIFYHSFLNSTPIHIMSSSQIIPFSSLYLI